MTDLTLADPNGRTLEIGRGCGTGEPLAAPFVTGAGPGEGCVGVNLSAANAERLRDRPAEFVASAKGPAA